MKKNDVFVLKQIKWFQFALESDPETVYALPPVRSMNLDDADFMVKIDEEESFKEKGKMIREFILKYVPELEEKKITDVEYLEIFQAYGMAQTEGTSLGESKASRNS